MVFLGTGARSYMNPEELAGLGIAVHTIKGYGDTAVAECAIALMWASARNIATWTATCARGNWLRADGMQLTGKTLGLIGFGGIAAEVARIALGSGMRVHRLEPDAEDTPGRRVRRSEQLLAESHVVSLHLLLNDETRGFLSRERIASMRPARILINTARGAMVDDAAMIEALKSGHIATPGSTSSHRAAAG